MSSTRFPRKVDSAVNPGPGLMPTESAMEKPKISSFGKVVVAVPLLTEVAVPMAAETTSRGAFILALEKSSWGIWREMVGAAGNFTGVGVGAPPPIMVFALKILARFALPLH